MNNIKTFKVTLQNLLDSEKIYRDIYLTIFNPDMNKLTWGASRMELGMYKEHEFKKLIPKDIEYENIVEIVEVGTIFIGLEEYFPNFSTELKNTLIREFISNISTLPKNAQYGLTAFTRDGSYGVFFGPIIVEDSVYSPVVKFITDEKRDEGIVDIITNIPLTVDDQTLLQSIGIKHIHFVNTDISKIKQVKELQFHSTEVIKEVGDV